MYTMIVCEKPTAAKKIAESLSEKKPKKHGEKKSVWYEFERDGKKYFSVPAVGHLYALKQTEKGWTYPKFGVEWIPSFKANRWASFSEEYFRNIESLVKECDDFIVATDYDTEGAVIGYNIIRFLCKQDNAKRMKFSTMTKEDLEKSFEDISKSMDKNLVESGLTRHYLDWYWGINLTRALTLSMKRVGKRFKILSTGRVQGPLLNILYKHEKKIRKFKPKPYWVISAEVKIGKENFIAEYEKKEIWDKKDSEKVMKSSKGKKAKLVDRKIRTYIQSPPKPYDTTTFLSDVSRYFGYTPKKALDIAEALYQKGLISYPRTSSQKLPQSIGYKNILSKLAKQKKYQKDCKYLLGKSLKPNEGNKKDSAHPAIYPTGEKPTNIGSIQKRVYDLVVRRFMATFGDPAKRESVKVELDIGGNKFYLRGKRTQEPGWTDLYGPYSQREDVILPEIKSKTLDVKSVKEEEKETQPPQRFSQGSALKLMDEKGLGTKATRAQILETLYTRGYIFGKSIEVTELGMSVAQILEKNIPDIVSEDLTRHFEEEVEQVKDADKKRTEVLQEARETLTDILTDYKKKEEKVGKELTKAVIEEQEARSILGPCPKCGKTLRVHKNWRTKKSFVGCDGYPDCNYGQPLPRFGLIEPTKDICDECKSPIIQVRIPGKRPFRTCVDINCPTKKEWRDDKLLKKVQEKSIESTKKAKKDGTFTKKKKKGDKK